MDPVNLRLAGWVWPAGMDFQWTLDKRTCTVSHPDRDEVFEVGLDYSDGSADFLWTLLHRGEAFEQMDAGWGSVGVMLDDLIARIAGTFGARKVGA